MNTPSPSVWLAIFLPRLATDRLIRAGRAAENKPLAVYAKRANAFVLSGVDARASALGLKLAMSLADARALHPSLETREAEPDEDARTLDHIAAWCERFTPIVVVDAPDGLFLDLSGCGHLFGGEAALRAEIVTRLQAQGFAARAALAATPGAAWALARYLERQRLAGEDAGGPSEALSPLPIEALRLDEDAAALLRRLGLKTIGQLLDAPRSAFTARAGQRAMLRLDQALGRAGEALPPRRPAPPVFALRRFLEPLFSVETILIAARALCEEAAAHLERRGAGARRVALHLYGVDGRDRVIEIGVSRPERCAETLLRLLREKLNIAAETLDAEFGIEAARLDVVQLARIESDARALLGEQESGGEQIAAIVDVLSARLGPARVLRPALHDAHAPERAGGWLRALASPGEATPLDRRRLAGGDSGGPRDAAVARPLTLFSRAQPIDAIAAVPDGPPLRFRWRRVLREIVRAEGPERITGDWLKGEPLRDFYRVEDAHGRRYWLYREGLYGEAETPRWFVAGLFA
jgi:protein ImuB